MFGRLIFPRTDESSAWSWQRWRTPRLRRIQLSNASSVCKHTIMLALRNLFTNTWSFYKRDSADAPRLVSVSERLDAFTQSTEWKEGDEKSTAASQRSEVRGDETCQALLLACFFTSFLSCFYITSSRLLISSPLFSFFFRSLHVFSRLISSCILSFDLLFHFTSRHLFMSHLFSSCSISRHVFPLI